MIVSQTTGQSIVDITIHLKLLKPHAALSQGCQMDQACKQNSTALIRELQFWGNLVCICAIQQHTCSRSADYPQLAVHLPTVSHCLPPFSLTPSKHIKLLLQECHRLSEQNYMRKPGTEERSRELGIRNKGNVSSSTAN